MSTDIQTDIDATILAGRLTGVAPWKKEGQYTISDGREAAIAQGVIIVVPQPNQLQLDIDNRASLDRYYSVQTLLYEYFDVVDEQLLPSKSGTDHYHITITLKTAISDGERILLQAILGSDPKREMLSYIRILRGVENPTCFFEQPKKLEIESAPV